jgi:predicted pyridoxine 5'-phosphate oxidase superfamily flavin-nucleotide-binding protein
LTRALAGGCERAGATNRRTRCAGLAKSCELPEVNSTREACESVSGERTESVSTSFFTAAHRDWIEGADTFFIGSLHAEAGVDCSHRGGNPGFVRVLNERRLAFPDYSGNNMFQTLGNLSVDPRAGLLFLNFETGDTLQLTGTTDIIWDQARLRDWPGAQRLVEFEVSKTIEARGASPLRWRLMDYSASNPR